MLTPAAAVYIAKVVADHLDGSTTTERIHVLPTSKAPRRRASAPSRRRRPVLRPRSA